MSKKTLPAPLQGIVVPMVTPLLDRDALDADGLERLIEHLITGGVHAIFIVGTTGEGPSLSYRLRRELIERTCKQVAGRIPVLVGITDTAFMESVHLGHKAEEAGADGLVLAPPYYFSTGQPELLDYFKRLTTELPLPLFIYNMPGLTKVSIEPQTVLAASEIPGIVGLKDSSGDMEYFHKVQRLMRDKPEFTMLVGPEPLLPETVLLGGHGGVNGGANLWPQLYVDLYNAARKGDLETVNTLHRKVIQIVTTVYSVGKYGSSLIKGLKCALSCLGICSDFVAEPFSRFGNSERKIIQGYLKELGLLRQ